MQTVSSTLVGVAPDTLQHWVQTLKRRQPCAHVEGWSAGWPAPALIAVAVQSLGHCWLCWLCWLCGLLRAFAGSTRSTRERERPVLPWGGSAFLAGRPEAANASGNSTRVCRAVAAICQSLAAARGRRDCQKSQRHCQQGPAASSVRKGRRLLTLPPKQHAPIARAAGPLHTATRAPRRLSGRDVQSLVAPGAATCSNGGSSVVIGQRAPRPTTARSQPQNSCSRCWPLLNIIPRTAYVSSPRLAHRRLWMLPTQHCRQHAKFSCSCCSAAVLQCLQCCNAGENSTALRRAADSTPASVSACSLESVFPRAICNAVSPHSARGRQPPVLISFTRVLYKDAGKQSSRDTSRHATRPALTRQLPTLHSQ